MSWNFNEDKPIFLQIAAEITRSIVSGKYAPGEKLPTVRDFALQAGVNPNTMQRALVEVEQNGLISTRRGDGRYVSCDENHIKSMGNVRLVEASSEFISSMLELGFSKDEILTQVEKRLKGGS